MYNDSEHSLLSEILGELELKHGKLTGRNSMGFVSRLSANFSTLRELFMSLYGLQSDREKRFRQLVLSLYSKFQQRPKTLIQQDRKRAATDQWVLNQKWVGMTLYPEHFAKTLTGFHKRLSYLEELGVNLVHLMPVLESPKTESDGGYAVSNYRKVKSHLGKMADIRTIAKKFRKRNMLLTLDLVLNHTSHHHLWAKKAKKGKKKYQDYYYMFADRTIPDQFEAHMPEVFPSSAPGNFTFLEELDKWVMTVFHKYQWDLNYRNPRVFIAMTSNLLHLANQGADIIRLDAPAFLWKEIGTNSQNLPQTHTILQLMKRCAEVVAPGVKFIAEAIVSPLEIVKYFGTSYKEHECDFAYNATLMALIWDALATTKVGLLNESLSKMPSKPTRTNWINYIRCHDDIGLGFDDEDIHKVGFNPRKHRSFLLDYYTGKFKSSMATGRLFMSNPANGDARISGTLASLAGLEKSLNQENAEQVEKSIKKIVLTHAVIMSFGGLPMIYSGDEIGQLNDYSYQNDSSRKDDNRWIHRPEMDWKSAKKRKDHGTVQNAIFTALQKLIGIRKNSLEFNDYNECKLVPTENPHILGFLRCPGNTAGDETRFLQILVLANFQSSTQFLKKDILTTYGFDMKRGVLDRYTGKAPVYKKDHIKLNPYQFYFICDKINI